MKVGETHSPEKPPPMRMRPLAVEGKSLDVATRGAEPTGFVAAAAREGQRIEAPPPDARLGLPEGEVFLRVQDWNQAWVVENPYGQATRCWRACWA